MRFWPKMERETTRPPAPALSRSVLSFVPSFQAGKYHSRKTCNKVICFLCEPKKRGTVQESTAATLVKCTDRSIAM
jgi:hypothetical protein